MIIFNQHKTIDFLEQFLSDSPVIVEAGAFDGNDTNKMAVRWPKGTVHAFEPLDEIIERLKKNTSKHKNIFYYHCALSSMVGEQLFYISEKPTRPGIASQAGSLHKPKERLVRSPIIFPRTTTVKTITLPAWMEQHAISYIDLLWLDTQGHELAILQAEPLRMQKIRVLLVEVSFIESYQDQPLYDDVVNWITNQDFELVGCDFENKTKSFFGNLVFVHKNFRQ